MAISNPHSVSQAVAVAVSQSIEAAGQNPFTIAQATGIPRTTLVRRLTGNSPFTVNELAAIASVLDVDIDSFISAGAGAA